MVESTLALVMAIGAGSIAIVFSLSEFNQILQTVTFSLGIITLVPVCVVRWVNLVESKGHSVWKYKGDATEDSEEDVPK